MAASPIRSSVESKNAPNFETRPVLRAMAPSMRSLNTKAVMNSTPTKRCPWGKKMRAPAATPAVPTRVMTSGLIPSLMKRLTKGASMTPCQKLLNRSNMTRARYRVGRRSGARDADRPVGNGPGSHQLGQPQVREDQVELDDVGHIHAGLAGAALAD